MNDEKDCRLICLIDGTGMGGDCGVYKTNAPKKRLKAIEKESNSLIEQGKDAPLWWKVLESEGYTFYCIDNVQNVTAYGTSETWMQNNYPKVKETYTLDY